MSGNPPLARRPGRGAWSAALAGAALLFGAGACEGERGEEGRYFTIVQVTSDVLAADLTELGIAQNGDLPDADETYGPLSRSGRVFWSSDWEGGEVQYLATVALRPIKGKKGESGLFPANDAVALPPLTADTGEDGKDVNLRILVRRNELHVFRAAEPEQGTPIAE